MQNPGKDTKMTDKSMNKKHSGNQTNTNDEKSEDSSMAAVLKTQNDPNDRKKTIENAKIDQDIGLFTISNSANSSIV